MSKNKSNKRKETSNTGATTMSAETPEVIGEENVETFDQQGPAVSDVTDDTQDPEKPVASDPDPDLPLDKPDVISPTIPITVVGNETELPPEMKILEAELKKYKAIVDAHQGIPTDEEHLVQMIRIVTHVAKEDKEMLFDMLFNRLFLDPANIVLSDRTFLTKFETMSAGPELKRVKVMYATMTTMKQYLEKPKNIPFPLDLKMIQSEFGGNAFVPFIKKTMGL